MNYMRLFLCKFRLNCKIINVNFKSINYITSCFGMSYKYIL